MQILHLTTPDGATAHTLHVPTSWADVTLAQYIRLCQQRSQPAILTLTDLSAEAFSQLAAQDAMYLNFLVEFTQDESELLALPAVAEMNLGAQPYGQLLLVQQFMEQHPNEPAIHAAPWLYAVYEAHKRYGQSNSADRMQELYAEMLARPVTEAFAECASFLLAWWRSTNATRPTPATIKSPMMTSTTRGWRNWGLGSRTS